MEEEPLTEDEFLHYKSFVSKFGPEMISLPITLRLPATRVSPEAQDGHGKAFAWTAEAFFGK